MQKIKKLSDIIEENNMCISKNEYGTERLWPYSFINKFYNQFCLELFLENQSPNILEINQKKEINTKMWEIYFKNIRVDNLIVQFNNISSIKLEKFYDFIILNNYDFIFNNDLIYILAKSLKPNGKIIIENINENSLKLINFYVKNFLYYDINIHDFRTERFILSNSLIELKIKKSILKKDIFLSFLTFCNYIFLNFIIRFLKISINISKSSFDLIRNFIKEI